MLFLRVCREHARNVKQENRKGNYGEKYELRDGLMQRRKERLYE
jgi:hypothetical protein